MHLQACCLSAHGALREQLELVGESIWVSGGLLLKAEEQSCKAEKIGTSGLQLGWDAEED